MAVTSATGAKVYISTTSAATTQSAFAALTWVEIKEIESIGDFGDESSSVTFTSLSDSRIRKYKGARDAGTIAVVCGNLATDPGQLAAVAAEKTKFDYPIKIVLADAADANDTNSTFYFQGQVMSAKLNVGGNDAIIKRTFNLAINSAVIEVPSTVVP